MGVVSGRGSPAALVTREVRWFQEGPIPDRVVGWFTDSVPYEMEQRVDCYDLEAARRGVGVKQRNMGPVDFKHQLRAEDGVSLAPGLTGRVEDWLKITTSLIDPDEVINGERVAIAKDILTRRYRLADSNGSDAGCEAELALVTVGHLEVWSLCFETFGNLTQRSEAFGRGIRLFLEETPLPRGFDLDQNLSQGYPAWISQHEPGARVAETGGIPASSHVEDMASGAKLDLTFPELVV